MLIDVDDQGANANGALVLGKFDASVLTVLAASEAELGRACGPSAGAGQGGRRGLRLARDRAAARGIRAAWLSLRAVVCTQCFSC